MVGTGLERARPFSFRALFGNEAEHDMQIDGPHEEGTICIAWGLTLPIHRPKLILARQAAAVIGRAFEGSRREYPHHEVGMLRTEQASR